MGCNYIRKSDDGYLNDVYLNSTEEKLNTVYYYLHYQFLYIVAGKGIKKHTSANPVEEIILHKCLMIGPETGRPVHAHNICFGQIV